MLQVTEIQQRIQSFNFYNWPFTSLKISPYRCSIYGFSCINANQIKCEICGETITAPADLDLDEAKLNQLAEKLKTQHTTDCFYHDLAKTDLPRLTTSFLFQYWDTYYHENLQTFESQSQEVNYPVISSAVKNYLTKDFQEALWQSNTAPFIEGQIDAAVVLSVFGWRLQGSIISAHPNETNTHLQCNLCGRKVQLSTYPSTKDRIQHLENNGSEGAEGSSDTIESFNPLDEHRYFCKWGRVPSTEGGKQYGWGICCEMLRYVRRNKGDFQDKVNPEGKSDDNMNIESVSPNEKISGELTKLKLDIVNTIQELKNKKDSTLKICNDILQKVQTMEIVETPELKERLKAQRQKLDELVEGLDLSAYPYKKVKLAKHPSQGPQ